MAHVAVLGDSNVGARVKTSRLTIEEQSPGAVTCDLVDRFTIASPSFNFNTRITRGPLMHLSRTRHTLRPEPHPPDFRDCIQALKNR